MDPYDIDYEAVNEGARVFCATAHTSLDALMKCIDRVHKTLGEHAIIHGAYTTFDGDNPAWLAQVVAS